LPGVFSGRQLFMVTPWLIDFREPKNAEELAIYLGISIDLLALLTGAARAALYLPHRIPKRNPKRAGECRLVFEPVHAVGNAHKNLLRRFDTFVRDIEPRYPHSCAHGYISHRSTSTNARPHCGATYILHADIENFFPTISIGRLNTLFLRLGIDPFVADLLAKLSTIDDKLALGLNASPLFANLVCLDLDDKLLALANKYDARYSRYADDLTFSSAESLPTKFEISNILAEEGFVLSERKFFTTKRGQSHFVTGLSVTDPKRPHVPKKLKRRLRQELYYSERFGLVDHISRAGYLSIPSGVNKIDGSLKYLSGVERELGRMFLFKWEAILNRDGMRPAYLPVHDQPVRNVTFYCDESEIETPQGTALAVGLVAIEQVAEIQQKIEQLLRRYSIDPFEDRKEKLRKKGLHYTDIHPDIRKDLVLLVAQLPIRGFVAYDLIRNYSNYENCYLRLLGDLLLDRFVYYDRAELNIVYEENPQLHDKEIQTKAFFTYFYLKTLSSRRPARMPKISVGKKLADPCLSIVDCLLGVFKDYAKGPTPRERTFFERLRDQYRLIISVPTQRFFTRKNPFTPWLGGDPTKSE
jgi:RNA-directed DNA polymerase